MPGNELERLTGRRKVSATLGGQKFKFPIPTLAKMGTIATMQKRMQKADTSESFVSMAELVYFLGGDSEKFTTYFSDKEALLGFLDMDDMTTLSKLLDEIFSPTEEKTTAESIMSAIDNAEVFDLGSDIQRGQYQSIRDILEEAIPKEEEEAEESFRE